MGYFKLRAVTTKSNAWRHDIQRLYFKFVNVNLGKNLESFVELKKTKT